MQFDSSIEGRQSVKIDDFTRQTVPYINDAFSEKVSSNIIVIRLRFLYPI